jgi:geranylgeranyl diphosphate synthase type II
MIARAYLSMVAQMVDAYLDRRLPPESAYPPEIHQAVRYSLFSGGKRLRPALVLATHEALSQKPPEIALPAASAVELIHTYSLIHDDLPCMDDDDLRRGKPTCHRKFGEATAVLAGDALFVLAFEVLTDDNLSPECINRIVRELAWAAGTRGMIGGQLVDMRSEGVEPNPYLVRYIHSHKTGALITACLRVGGIVASTDSDTLELLGRAGRRLGLAFQIVDDILDVEGDPETVGKQTKKDAEAGKQTYPRLYGVERSRKHAEKLVSDARGVLSQLGPRSETLLSLADVMVNRID